MSLKKMNISSIFAKLDYLLMSYNSICISISVPFVQDIEDT